MAGHMDCCIMEKVQAATGIDFDTEVMAKERLRLPARMKGGGIKRATDTMYPTFLGALLAILPRCMDMNKNNREITKGIYSDHLTTVIGEGAFDEAGRMNTRFMEATTIGPYPREMHKAWDTLMDEAAVNYGFREGFQEDEARERMGPLAEPTPAMVRNKGATKRKRARRGEAFDAERDGTTMEATREEETRREERDTQQQQEGLDESPENMDALLEAVAEAISRRGERLQRHKRRLHAMR